MTPLLDNHVEGVITPPRHPQRLPSPLALRNPPPSNPEGGLIVQHQRERIPQHTALRHSPPRDHKASCLPPVLQPCGAVATLAGGPGGGGDSSSSRRSYARRTVYQLSIPPHVLPGPITFTDEDLMGVELPHDDPLVLSPYIEDFVVDRMLIDTGSSVDVLFVRTYDQLGHHRHQIRPLRTALLGFSGHPVSPLGTALMNVTFGTDPTTVTLQVLFTIVDLDDPSYNGIIGRTTLTALRAIVSPLHLMLKFPTPGGIGVMRGDQKRARICYNASTKRLAESQTEEPRKRSRDLEPEVQERQEREDREKQVLPNEDLEKVEFVAGNPHKIFRLGTTLGPQHRNKVIALIREFVDVFAWSHDDMPGVDPNIIIHKLHVDPGYKPVKQKKRNFSDEKNAAIREEVDKLLIAKSIRELQFPDWIANVVLVKKPSGEWRMCTDFTSLNKACPKDWYPLPCLNRLVDGSAGYLLFDFLDAFRGYHQIRMDVADQEKTTFITEHGLYCWVVMPFGLKNAGATYQRMVNAMFQDQIGRNMEIYVDDMLIKSLTEQAHLDNLRETLERLRAGRLRINPDKCSFGVSSGKFLGYMISPRGIEPNPDKIQALVDMHVPSSYKDIQKLTGCLAALGRFISKSGERNLPYFKCLRRASKQKFEWDEECDQAFRELKEYLGSPKLLTRPEPGETLQVYLAVSKGAVSGVLVKEQEGVQRPIYYVSHVLHGPEERYPVIDKFALALIMTARKLKAYFESHPIQVITNQPLKKVLTSPVASGRLTTWAIELSEFQISYIPQGSIKAQALADFVVEHSGHEGIRPECETSEATLGAMSSDPTDRFPGPATLPPGNEQHNHPSSGDLADQFPVPATLRQEFEWVMHVDGARNQKGCGAGIVIEGPLGIKLEYALRFGFPTTNNEAEYEALITGLMIIKGLGLSQVLVKGDSKLIMEQIKGEYDVRSENLQKYRATAIALARQLINVEFQHIPRELNEQADRLSHLATTYFAELPKGVYIEIKDRPSHLETVMVIQEGREDWKSPIVTYLTQGVLPNDPAEARKITNRSLRFLLIQGELYKKSFTGPLLKCVGAEHKHQILRDVHEGDCGSHVGGRNLAFKIQRAGYFWPTLITDAAEYVKTCDPCQKMAPIVRQPAATMTTVSSPIPFAMWGIDIVGKMPTGRGGVVYAIVAVDYFSKWVEARAVTTITCGQVKNFLWKNIITRFGIPQILVSDNGTQFEGQAVVELCKRLGIEQRFSPVCYPQANGQVERMNKTIFEGIKKNLLQKGGHWSEELDVVLWSYRTTPSASTGETPFSLVYGAEAILPVEMEPASQSLRVALFEEKTNEKYMREALDMVEEKRDLASVRMARYKQLMTRFYNRRVRARQFKIGDLVLRILKSSMPLTHHKLSPKWEGPYKVIQIMGPGSYRLEGLDGESIGHTWHAANLKKYYP